MLYDDWLIKLGENRPDQGSLTFGGYPGTYSHKLLIETTVNVLRNTSVDLSTQI